jgi:hypothetical protein
LGVSLLPDRNQCVSPEEVIAEVLARFLSLFT